MNNRRLAVWLLLTLVFLAPAGRAAEVACGSTEGEFVHCALPGADKLKVKLKQRLDGVCASGTSWGVDSEGVWVDMGCRAVFRYSAASVQKAGWKRFLPNWLRRH